MWFFRNLNDANYSFIFSTREKALAFVKVYGIQMFNQYEDFPIYGEDYFLDEVVVDPDIETALENMFASKR